ncbi:hypothetical protein NKT34_18220 [Paenibacillus polysaccharolyticus]|uniref:hypothetical protein n=1 Tax=Paenibacillus polysaccharolyticus TaxID=582692 RepID=UPI00209F2BEB|nr:hypothetical protein [Paenibacillus polysaccharolyticus]MCP1135239.1 hypothetical protein [Paenibacillus polysaccharolyticus]
MITIFQENNRLNQLTNSTLNIFIELFIEFAGNLSFEEMYADIFPKEMSSQEKCKSELMQLRQYVIDDFPHTLKPIHEFILYKLLDYMSDAMDLDEQEEIFNNQIKKYYDKNNEISDETKDILDSFQDINYLIGLIFEDVDFLDVGILYQMYIREPLNFEKIFNVNLDDYVDLMPQDIRKEYEKVRNTDFSNAVEALIDIQTKEGFIEIVRGLMRKFNYYVKHKQLYKLINNKQKVFSEDEIQILFDFYIDLYLKNYNLDISRESHTGRGYVDFKISCGKRYRALIEFKVDSHSSLKKGLEYQLPLYQHVTGIDYGIFSIIYYDEKSYEDKETFEKEVTKISKDYEITIDFFPIDARHNKKAASTVKNKADMLIEED